METKIMKAKIYYWKPTMQWCVDSRYGRKLFDSLIIRAPLKTVIIERDCAYLEGDISLIDNGIWPAQKAWPVSKRTYLIQPNIKPERNL